MYNGSKFPSVIKGRFTLNVLQVETEAGNAKTGTREFVGCYLAEDLRGLVSSALWKIHQVRVTTVLASRPTACRIEPFPASSAPQHQRPLELAYQPSPLRQSTEFVIPLNNDAL
tara:strand:+ start:42336 stop:42677 length:342 start_codon:yes stop_codon:yes gene_type:complete